MFIALLSAEFVHVLRKTAFTYVNLISVKAKGRNLVFKYVPLFFTFLIKVYAGKLL